jgi:hypothetical protein
LRVAGVVIGREVGRTARCECKSGKNKEGLAIHDGDKKRGAGEMGKRE